MTRGIGEFGPIQELIPEWLAVLIVLATQLADAWFLVLLLVTLYWVHADRQAEIASVAGVTIGGIGLYRGLKHVFALPRPERPLLDSELLPALIRPLYELTATAGGYGFPSGHATSATIVYFGLATVLAIGSRRQRFTAAAAVVAVVCFSRVALGLHFVVDVVAGVAVGGTLLVLAFWLRRRVPTDETSVTLGVAIPLTGFYAYTSSLEFEAVVLAAAALGAFAGWQLVVLGATVLGVDRPSLAARPLAIRGGLAALALVPLVVGLEEFPLVHGTVYAVAGLVGLVTAAVVTVPVLRYSENAQTVYTALVFWARAAFDGLRRLCTRGTVRRALTVGRHLVRRSRSWLAERRQSDRR